MLSFDLPEHGDRKNDPVPCHIYHILEEFKQIEEFIEGKYETISLYANSMGAYFSLVGWKDLKITQACFLSPVVDMLDIIENMMLAFSISEEELSKKKVIPTPIGQTLYLDYYEYVKTHPIKIWDVKTTILYGELDEMCGYDKIKLFCENFSCELEIVEGAKHYFHTPKEIEVYQQWIKKHFQK